MRSTSSGFRLTVEAIGQKYSSEGNIKFQLNCSRHTDTSDESITVYLSFSPYLEIHPTQPLLLTDPLKPLEDPNGLCHIPKCSMALQL